MKSLISTLPLSPEVLSHPLELKGAWMRHYVLRTVRDQVAFMAYLVLLGPLRDSRAANFVSGNRRIAWDRGRSRPQGALVGGSLSLIF